MPDEKETDFNIVIHDQLNSIIAAKGISSELKIQDQGYQMTITIEKTFEEDEY